MEDIQIFIITCSEERTRIMTNQMKALRISIPYTFFQGYTPATSVDYIVDRDSRSPEKDTMMCCMRSHGGALHRFVTEFPKSQYALIIEDDAALITNFEAELGALVARWQHHMDDIEYVSLGYFPSKGPHTSSKRDRSLLWNLTSMVWGTQAYIVKRSAAVKMAQVLHHPTSKALRSAFTQYIKNELSGVPRTNKHPVIQPDAMIPIGWKQAVAFPLLVIELPINSTITATDNHVSMGMWEPVFTDGGRKKQDFYSIPTAPSAISILKSLTLEGPVLPNPTKKRRIILCADNRSPYKGTNDYWTYCVMMTDAYSKLIGVDFKFELLKTTERHPAWEKIRIVQTYVDSYDEIMWFDSDATVLNKSVNVFDYIRTAPESEWKRDASKKPVLYALSDKPFSSERACSGIFLVDCSDKAVAHTVLTEWWNDLEDKIYETKHPWEQAVWNLVWKDTPKASYIRVADVYSMVVKEQNQVFFHAINAYKNARLSVVKKYFYKQLYPTRAKRFGILVRQQNYYTNGCGQNCIFIMQSLEALGYDVDLLINYKADKPVFVSDTIKFSYTNIASVQLSDYEAIIFGSELPFKADNDRMKAAGTRRIMFNPCNVVDQFHNEHFLYKCHETPMPLQEMTYKDIADEVWIIESHKESTLTYMEVINKNKIPVVAVPHIWSPLFLQDAEGSVPMNRPHTGKKMDIVIMEPNMGYCKSGWLPLIICEKIQLDHPDAINQVFFFGTPDSNPTAMGMIHSLELWKSKKLRTMTRMPITDILSFFSDPKKHGENPTVFLSHSIHSPLNYAYFDALYAGFPFVHNSLRLKEKGIGYYYKGIADAVDAIMGLPTSYSIEESVGKAHKFLAIQDPYSVESLTAFKQVLSPKVASSPGPLLDRGVDRPIKRIALPAEGVRNTVTYGSRITEINKAFVVNLDRRADRYALFQKNHPSFAGSVTRVSAVDGKQLKLTSDLVHLFRGNDFNWLKGIMGCALSHYNLWKQLAESATDTCYLVFEDDVVCPPDFIEKVSHYIRHMPADTDVLYLGGVLPANKELFDTVIEPVNEHIGRIKLRADTGTRFFHFGAYSYILTKRGAKALMDYIGEHGIYQAIDMILCRRYKTMNIYFSLPHLCTITQYNDPSFITSSFNDVANQNVYDSDIANTKDRFTEEEVQMAAVGIHKAYVINLDRRADRYALFQKNHPSFSSFVTRVSAVDGKQLKLTSDLVHLFRGNEFNWAKGIIGCALSHYTLWKQLLDSTVELPSLVVEDDVVCGPEFMKNLANSIRHMPADTDILYLGCVIPANKEMYDRSIQPVNEYVGKVGGRFFPFTTSSYVITQNGLRKLMTYIKSHGFHMAVDMLMCCNFKLLNLYMSLPTLASVTQYDSLRTTFHSQDSDVADHDNRFTEEDIRAASIQILVVSACDKRKAILEQQFKELEIPFPIRYLEAKVLDAEAPGYVPEGVTTIERRSILSTRSHIRALEIAGQDTSPAFTLILEDDVALHTTEFKTTLLRIMETYDTIVAPHSGILSLGWIPCNNYSFYSQLANPSVLNASYTIHQRFTPGTQAYLIKRSKAAEYTPLFKHATHRALTAAILAKKHPMITKESQIVVFDDFGTKLLDQCILFPPLVIEQPNTSLIRGTEENPYWAQFFKGHEAVRSRYWKAPSLNDTQEYQDISKPLVVTYDNKPNECTQRFFKTLEANKWDFVALGEGEEWNGFLTRVIAYERFLQKVPAEKLVVLSDARDVFCVRSPYAIMEAFQSFKKDIVVSMELLCNGQFAVDDNYRSQLCVPLTKYWNHHGVVSLPARKFVNAGLLLGKAGALRHCFQYVREFMTTHNYVNDQSAFGAYINEYPDRVACDVDATVLHSSVFGVNAGIQNIHRQKEDSPTLAELFGRGAFFLHLPGIQAKGPRVVYDHVWKAITLGINDKRIREPYGYGEPNWNEHF